MSRLGGSGLIIATGLLAAMSMMARAQSPSPEQVTATPDVFVPDEIKGVGLTQNVGGEVPRELRFRDDRGQLVRLGDYLDRGKPLILSMNYSNCPHQCNWQLSGLATKLNDLPLDAGSDYEFVSVSLDPKELFQRASETKVKTAAAYGRGDAGFHFLVGSRESIDALAKALGISYRKIEGLKSDYSHPAALAVVSPSGKISRYLLGLDFDEQTLRLALVEAGEGKIGSIVDGLVLTCFYYDDSAGRFVPAALRIMFIGMGFTAIVVFFALLGLHWRESRRIRAVKFASAH